MGTGCLGRCAHEFARAGVEGDEQLRGPASVGEPSDLAVGIQQQHAGVTTAGIAG